MTSFPISPGTSPLASSLSASPLAEAQITSLDEFFSRNPRELTDADLDIIVAEQRKARAAREAAAAVGKVPRTKKVSAPVGPAPSLDDLGLL